MRLVTGGSSRLISKVSRPFERLFRIWLNVVVYCSIRCSKLLTEVSDLFKERNAESRLRMASRACARFFVTSFLFCDCAKPLMDANKSVAVKTISAAGFITLHMFKSGVNTCTIITSSTSFRQLNGTNPCQTRQLRLCSLRSIKYYA